MGYGLVRQADGQLALAGYGVLTTPADQPLPQRLKELYAGLLGIIERFHPDEVAVEQLFVRRSFTAAQSVYQARGVALLAAANCGLPVSEYTPLQVKLAITRYGRATKDQIQEMVRTLLGLDAVPEPDDAADALAVAVCHFYTGQGR
ncbi:MAG: crossover junction endodeoxyribonuclease RuvC [Bacteroidetes bacterium]|nr:crossover junction endodeoxyribonuclease RuvC [Bacteroidota bacterium]